MHASLENHRKAVILGAKSDVAQALCYELAAENYHLVLVARKVNVLEALQADLKLKHEATVELLEMDFLQYESFSDILTPHLDADLVVSVFGYLGDHEKAEEDFTEAHRILQTNYEAACLSLHAFSKAMQKRKAGTIVGISSVAGERGRQSNYFYGSAKAGFTAFLSGLRNKMVQSNVHVMTVKPGFMDTAMTAHLTLPGPLTASPQQAAKAIRKGIKSQKNVIYVLGRWRLVMFIIRNIPEFIFKKLKL